MKKQKYKAVTAMSPHELPAWISILEVTEFSKLSTIQQSYQHLMRKNHDDPEKLAELKGAWRQAQEQVS